MTWTAPDLSEARQLLRSLKGSQFDRALHTVAGEASRRADQPALSPHEFLGLCVLDWLAATTPLGEMEQSFLLGELRAPLARQAERLALAEDAGELPQFLLCLAECQYAIWPDQEKWWDVFNARWTESLEKPALWSLSLDVNVLYFRSLKQLDHIRMAPTYLTHHD